MASRVKNRALPKLPSGAITSATKYCGDSIRHDQQQPLRLDRELLEATDLEAIAGPADLREDEREFHPDGRDVEPIGLADIGVDRNAVEPHDHGGDPTVDVVDDLLESFGEHRIDGTSNHMVVPGHRSVPLASVQQSTRPSWYTLHGFPVLPALAGIGHAPSSRTTHPLQTETG